MAESVFRLPDLGEGLTEAQLLRWRVEEGQEVAVNAPLCEVETAKAEVVIPSPWSGTVRSLHARVGESVPVGAPLVTVVTSEPAGTDGAEPSTLVGYGPGFAAEDTPRRRRRPERAVSDGDDVRAAPFVRQLARERGIDLSTVKGSGPGGRITRSDVEAADHPQAGELEAAAAPSAGDQDERVSVVGVRKAIARQMLRSVTTIPQFTEFALFDASHLIETRERANAGGRAPTPLSYFVRATVAAVRDFPLLNSSWDDASDEIVIKRAVHVGLAVNTQRGLLVPVLRNADGLDLDGIAAESARLIQGARDGSLKPSEMTGSTITVTNVGASGPIETGTPIINPPECCVVGFGAIRPRALVVDGQVMARQSAWISITVDHRIVDGALATQFLTALVRYLEARDA